MGEKGRRRDRELLAMKITRHQDKDFYKRAFEAAMEIFEISKSVPKEETYSMTSQIRRSSRSVCANIAEAWRKRRYEAAFISKLSDAEGEAAETQTWIEFYVRSQYGEREKAASLFEIYNGILGSSVSMTNSPGEVGFTIGTSKAQVFRFPYPFSPSPVLLKCPASSYCVRSFVRRRECRRILRVE